MASKVLSNTRDSRNIQRDMHRGIYVFKPYKTRDIKVADRIATFKRIGIVQGE